MTNDQIIVPATNMRLYASAEEMKQLAKPRMSRKRLALNIAIGMLLAYLVERQVTGPSIIATLFGV